MQGEADAVMQDVLLPTTDEWSEHDWHEVMGNGYIEVDVRDVGGGPSEWRPTLEEVVKVHAMAVKNYADGEPTYYALIELTGGRWAAVEGWHDYTGWDCQAGCTWNVASTRDDAWLLGFGDEARDYLSSAES